MGITVTGFGGITLAEHTALHHIKIGYVTRSTSGTQAITGLGFTPKRVLLFAVAIGGTTPIWSDGLDDGTIHSSRYAIDNSVDLGLEQTTKSIVLNKAGGNSLHGYVSSMDADGFTITWALTGALSGYLIYMALA